MKRIFLLCILSFAITSHAEKPRMLVANGGEVQMLAITRPSFIKILGKGSAPSGHVLIDGNKVTGQFDFDLNSLDTDIDKRNEHMKQRKYLEVAKFPKTSLEMRSTLPSAAWSTKNPALTNGAFDGTLTLHGVSNPVDGTYQIDADGRVNVNFKIKLSDYSIATPSFAGITVANNVDVTVKIDRLE